MDVKWVGFTLAWTGAGVAALIGAAGVLPDVPVLPPCVFEDGSGPFLPCVWDASEQGNLTGVDVRWYPVGSAAVEANRNAGGCEWTEPDRVGIFVCE